MRPNVVVIIVTRRLVARDIFAACNDSAIVVKSSSDSAFGEKKLARVVAANPFYSRELMARVCEMSPKRWPALSSAGIVSQKLLMANFGAHLAA